MSGSRIEMEGSVIVSIKIRVFIVKNKQRLMHFIVKSDQAGATGARSFLMWCLGLVVGARAYLVPVPCFFLVFFLFCFLMRLYRVW